MLPVNAVLALLPPTVRVAPPRRICELSGPASEPTVWLKLPVVTPACAVTGLSDSVLLACNCRSVVAGNVLVAPAKTVLFGLLMMVGPVYVFVPRRMTFGEFAPAAS